jgi:Arc/MetJ family transcription regulator
MYTNIDIDEQLVVEACKYAPASVSRREAVETALKAYLNVRKRKSLKDLKGAIQFREGYDYKAMRAAR